MLFLELCMANYVLGLRGPSRRAAPCSAGPRPIQGQGQRQAHLQHGSGRDWRPQAELRHHVPWAAHGVPEGPRGGQSQPLKPTSTLMTLTDVDLQCSYAVL